MDLKFSKVTRKGPVTIVTLSRPEVYNALHIDAHFELNKVFDDFAADPEQWVAIVTGAGGQADTRLGQGEGRVLGGDDEIAGERDFEAATHRDAVDGGNDRLVAVEARRE